MPRGDGTGPPRMGPMTGRAAGYCAGYPVPGFMNPIGGGGYWGWGRGGGGGRGRRNWFYATGLPGWQRAAMGVPAYGAPAAYPTPYAAPPMGVPTEQEELDVLKMQADYFQKSLEEIKDRIGELESQTPDKTQK